MEDGDGIEHLPHALAPERQWRPAGVGIFQALLMIMGVHLACPDFNLQGIG
jgi:hypothetical protein